MKPRASRSNGAWTFVEMLVAISLSAVFMGAATLVFGSITANSKRLTTAVDVAIGEATNENFYGQSGGTVRVYSAPNYGKASFALLFREQLRDDFGAATIVHCLPRVLPNTVRPEFLRYEAGDVGSNLTRPRLDSPEAFRQYLLTVEPDADGIYDTAIRNLPSAERPNTTIYLLAPSEDPGYLRVVAVYEIDFVPVSNPAGTYASARRYKNGALTAYYDVFYESGSGSLPIPSFVAFEHSSRAAVAEGSALDRFKLADWSPFYLLWLPDPAINPHQIANAPPVAAASNPVSAYEHLGPRSTLSLVVPIFPNL